MSMDTCNNCSAAVDTDFNVECYDSGACLCPYCSDKEREENDRV